MRLRRKKLYFATFRHAGATGETVDVPVRAHSSPEAERRAKMLVAEGWDSTLLHVRRESWHARRARAAVTAPTAKERERRFFAVMLFAGGFVTVIAVFVATLTSTVAG